MNRISARQHVRAAVLSWTVLCAVASFGQQTPAAGSDTDLADSVRELRQQVQELRSAVSEIRAEAQQYRAETEGLRKELAELRQAGPKEVAPVTGPASEETQGPSVAEAALNENQEVTQRASSRAATLDEQYELLAGKIDEQYQTKVESSSKYRMRISGIVLLNLFGNQGTVDNIDFPSLAYDHPNGSSGGSMGATLRQSQIGFEVFGPVVGGARTRADLQVDFGGGFTSVSNGSNYALMRLRTGTVRMDWEKTSIVGGQDGLFFSPTTPTSFANLAVPALSYTGNLWSWTPQLRVEHRWNVGEQSKFILQGGILDPMSGEAPSYGYYRQPTAGESSRQPAFATRAAFTHTLFGLPMHMGVAGYYSRQDYGFDRNVDAWAGMGDWDMPLGKLFSLSGKIYRGKGLGGIGGGIGRSVILSGNWSQPGTLVRGLNSVGGWAQLKFRPATKVELNAAFGEDNPFSSDLRAFVKPVSFGDPSLARNRAGFVNVIFRPRSDLLLSAEYGHIDTSNTFKQSYTADRVNLGIGVLF